LFTIGLYIWQNLAGWIQRNVKGVRSDLVRILNELSDSEALRRNRIFEEMDYIHEVENAKYLNNI
jgi:predicted unusual protein kinase regulating ubiquinone biosynthesis (AarF/ABC1/UbiB family)